MITQKGARALLVVGFKGGFVEALGRMPAAQTTALAAGLEALAATITPDSQEA